MQVSSKAILLYLDALSFPVEIFTENWSGVAACLDRREVEMLAGSGSLVAIGTARKLRRLRFVGNPELAMDLAMLRLKESGGHRSREGLNYLAGMISARKFIRRVRVTRVDEDGVELRTGVSYWQHKHVY